MSDETENLNERSNPSQKVQTSIMDSNINILKTNKNVLNVDPKIKAKGRFVASRYMEEKDPKKPLKAFGKNSSEGSSENIEFENIRKNIARSSSISGLFVNKPLKPLVRRNTRISAGSTEMICSTTKSSKASTPVKKSSNNSTLSTSLDISAIPKTLFAAGELRNSIAVSNPDSSEKSIEPASISANGNNMSLIAEMNWARRLQSEYLLSKVIREFQQEEANALTNIMSLLKFTEEFSHKKHMQQLKQMHINHDLELIDFLETQKSLLPECRKHLERITNPLKDLTAEIYKNNCHFNLVGVNMPKNKDSYSEELASVLAESNKCLDLINNLSDDFITNIEDLTSNLAMMNSSIEMQINDLDKSAMVMIKSGPLLLNQIIEKVFNC